MSYLLILAAAGAAYIANPRTTLDAQEAADLGIAISAHNFNYEVMDAPAPLFITLELSGFTACQIKDVGIEAKDADGVTQYGSSIANQNGTTYSFRLERSYLEYSDMAIMCYSGPQTLNYVYLFNLGELVQTP